MLVKDNTAENIASQEKRNYHETIYDSAIGRPVTRSRRGGKAPPRKNLAPPEKCVGYSLKLLDLV